LFILWLSIPLFLYFAFGLFNIVAPFLIVHNSYLFYFFYMLLGFLYGCFFFFFVVLIFLLLLFSLFLWLFLAWISCLKFAYNSLHHCLSCWFDFLSHYYYYLFFTYNCCGKSELEVSLNEKLNVEQNTSGIIHGFGFTALENWCDLTL
jgi:hypothetical protein